MSAEGVHASVLVFPLLNPVEVVDDDEVARAKPANVSFSLNITRPDVVTLYTADASRGDEIRGTLHFPTIPSNSSCRHIGSLPNTTLADDLTRSAFSSFPAIAFAPWDLSCNRIFLDAAVSDSYSLAAFVFYDVANPIHIPFYNSDHWKGLGFNNYSIPIYAIPGNGGQLLMDKYATYASNKSMAQDIHNTLGRARLFVRVDTGSHSTLPGLWLFLLIILGILIVLVVLTSACMHVIQFRRRRALRRRVASGEVDLEALGIKRLHLTKDMVEKMPLMTYSASPMSSSDENPTAKYDQPCCTICLEDFVVDATQVRELPCKHIFHPNCIDDYLQTQSSLCPLCKRSVLPKGYVPAQLTNATVRRERHLRRQRERAARGGASTANGSGEEREEGRRRTGLWATVTEMQSMRARAARSRSGRTERSTILPQDEQVRRRGWRRATRAVFPGFA